ncbi:MAG: hypothetical protein KGN34_03890 [Sphingomonadales bacterium]|nr:hypothetical protein [Sphingomonadales bacterium]
MAHDGMFGMARLPRSMVFAKPPLQQLAPGITLDRLQPGGRDGPQGEVKSLWPGGRVWTDMFHLGTAADDFIMTVPDIRLPANQYWPLHWHDCWIAVVVLEGTCLIGDWWMEPGDVMITTPGLEYGPLVIGPDGCQMFEVFAQLHLSGGGYSPEYRDHPTLAGGQHVFADRSGANLRNQGRMSLPCDGVEGLTKTRLAPGMVWDLGEPDDPQRGVMGCTALAAGERWAAHHYDDWHALFVMRGSVTVGGQALAAGGVLTAQPGARVPELVADADGAELFEAARTSRGWYRRA